MSSLRTVNPSFPYFQRLERYAGSAVISIPFEFDFTLDQWLNALQVMLEKTKGNPRLDKLRVIQLIEADLNMMLRIIFGRRLVHWAEDKYY